MRLKILPSKLEDDTRPNYAEPDAQSHKESYSITQVEAESDAHRPLQRERSDEMVLESVCDLVRFDDYDRVRVFKPETFF